MNKEILRLAVPNIISNISIPLISSVDTALMGHLSAAHLGAVGIGSMIFNFVYWNFGFLRAGTVGLTAQAYGKNDENEIAQTLGKAVFVGIILTILILSFQRPIANFGVKLMNVETAQIPLLLDYFFIRIWAAPATFGSYIIMGWFFGLQNAIYPLIYTLVLNFVNIGASYYLVVHCGMEADGVALGTVIAQYVGLFTGLVLMFSKYRKYLSKIRWKAVTAFAEMKDFLKINVDLFIRTFCLTLAFSFFYSQSAAGGELMLAVNVVLLQFLNWMSYGVDGFAYASESLVGKYFGAKNEAKTRQAVTLSFWWGMGFAAAFSIAYWIFGVQILKLFTNQPEVIAAGIPFLFWMIIFPFAGAPSYLWDGIYIGMTAARALRNTMLISLVIFFASWWYFQPIYGNHGLWLTLLVFLVARGVLQWIWYRRMGMELK